jgi:hypothetical protein
VAHEVCPPHRSAFNKPAAINQSKLIIDGRHVSRFLSYYLLSRVCSPLSLSSSHVSLSIPKQRGGASACWLTDDPRESKLYYHIVWRPVGQSISYQLVQYLAISFTEVSVVERIHLVPYSTQCCDIHLIYLLFCFIQPSIWHSLRAIGILIAIFIIIHSYFVIPPR